MAGPELDRVMGLLSRLPGLGPRSARRAALALIADRDGMMRPLADALSAAADSIKSCSICGNLDTTDPCRICTDRSRDSRQICVVARVGDLWAIERSKAYRGRFHVLGGLLSAIDGTTPETLRIPELLRRAVDEEVDEIILALDATVDGQTTAHYIAERLETQNIAVSRLAQGVPVGGELDYLDDGTLTAALASRRSLSSR